QAALADFGQRLLADYPTLQIQGLVCDYRQALALLGQRRERPKLFLFLGSSLGNYDLADARELLTQVRAAMTAQDSFLLGLDCKKDPALLHAAYNDAQGVTAAFNLNLLARINRELGGHFNVERFRHVAFYSAAQSRIEMHLESLDSQIVPVDAARRSFRFSRGERIHTENSYKYAVEDLRALLAGTGLRLRCQWSDPAGWFSLNLLAAGQPHLESP
ncbi:MAG TPA: L-histidine N(alpha)-methyltransferase, partial [bacterium]|nr:L-histidine N(alpha)-methyltransferase [bacterium]